MRDEILKIRALTLYVRPPDMLNEVELWLKEKTDLLRELSDKIESQTGLEVWTKRISINLLKDEDVEMFTTLIHNYSDIKFMLYQRTITKLNLKLLKKVVASGAYSALIVKNREDLGLAAKAIEEVSSDNLLYATRVAYELSGKPFETAYFPLSLHTVDDSERLALALLYPLDALNAHGDLEKALKDTLEKIYARLKVFLKNGVNGIKLSGIDYSLSPWMEESVAKFIQEKGKCTLTNLGCLEEVQRINNILLNFSRKRGGIGFNEVMLPLGEDDELKSLVEQGKMTIKDFLIYSTICVAGIDMIPVRYSYEELLNLLKASYAIARQKRRPYGIRLISVKEAKRKILLEGFVRFLLLILIKR